MKTVSFSLAPDEMDTLTLALGYAAGAAMKNRQSILACTFFELANRIHRDNPDWVPYQLPDRKERKERVSKESKKRYQQGRRATN